jgi:hypothetical protein
MKYEHRVVVGLVEGKPHVIIDRVDSDGRRSRLTHYELPHVANEQEGWVLMDKIAVRLGSDLLLDCPEFRKHIGINDEAAS